MFPPCAPPTHSHASRTSAAMPRTSDKRLSVGLGIAHAGPPRSPSPTLSDCSSAGDGASEPRTPPTPTTEWFDLPAVNAAIARSVARSVSGGSSSTSSSTAASPRAAPPAHLPTPMWSVPASNRQSQRQNPSQQHRQHQHRQHQHQHQHRTRSGLTPVLKTVSLGSSSSTQKSKPSSVRCQFHPYAMPPYRTHVSPRLPLQPMANDYYSSQRGYPSFQSQLQESISMMNNSIQNLGQGHSGHHSFPLVDTRVQIDDMRRALEWQNHHVLPVQQPMGYNHLPLQPQPHQAFYTPPQAVYALPSTAPTPFGSPSDRGRSQSLAPPPTFERALSPAAARGSAVPSRPASRGPSRFSATPTRSSLALPRASPYPSTPSRRGSLVPSRRSGSATPAPLAAPLPAMRRPPIVPPAPLSFQANVTVSAPESSGTVDPAALVLPRRYMSVRATPNRAGLHLVVIDRATAAALNCGAKLQLLTPDGRRRFKAHISAAAAAAPVPTLEEATWAIASAKESIEAARARELENAAVAGLMHISTPRDATFGARINLPVKGDEAAAERPASAAGSASDSDESSDDESDADADAKPEIKPGPVSEPMELGNTYVSSPRRPTKAAKMPRSSAPVPPPASPGWSSASSSSDEDGGDDYVPPGKRARTGKGRY